MTLQEFNICVNQLGPRLLQFADRQISDIEQAKDMVQESFIALMNKLDGVETEKAKPFLFAVVRNKVKDFYKLKKDTVEIESQHQIGSTQAAYESKDLVYKALEKLSARDKELIVLRDLEAYSYEEISDMVDLSLAQVKVYLFRARKAFKEQIIKLEVYHDK
ncbi:MAG: RNA polymerase sigma factor [Flavobacteriales bacterium]|nr:RNA polymerase sigma factor [Flavobacteriales bacterium]